MKIEIKSVKLAMGTDLVVTMTNGQLAVLITMADSQPIKEIAEDLSRLIKYREDQRRRCRDYSKIYDKLRSDKLHKKKEI